MIPFKKIAKKPLQDTKGFTLMELMVVIAIVAVLAAIAIFNYMPTRAKALDSVARSDARNVVSSVIVAITNNADIKFSKNDSGGAIGDTDTADNPRQPIFTLSNGVLAVISGSSDQNPGGNNTVFLAHIYHPGGTKVFSCSVDAAAGTINVPN